MDGADNDDPTAAHADSHHPGPPKFVQVGEPLLDPAYVGAYGVFGVRDNLAPSIPEPTATPENYDPDDFEWSIIERPDGSDAELTFDHSVPNTPSRWNAGAEHVAAFEADVLGRYVFELDAPDGTHEWTLHAFPAGDGPRPRLTLDARFDEEKSDFVIEADVREPPASASTSEPASSSTSEPANSSNSKVLETVYLADDRDTLETAAIERDGLDARIPIEAVDGEPVRLHAAAWDGENRSMMDTLELAPDGTVSFPNRPPEWAKDGVMYQIFTRSWAGERGETTMADLIDGVEYLDELGIDMVWLTPVVPDEATARQYNPELLPDSYRRALGPTLSGGGPHGYGTLDYFTIAPDLVPDGEDPIEAYQEFIAACHNHDIKVIFDLVISHSARTHPFFQDTIAEEGPHYAHPKLRYPVVSDWDEQSEYFDWYDRIDRPRRSSGIQVEPTPHATGFFGLQSLPNLNYNNVALREYMLAVADFWSGEVGVDGFRCDIAWGVPQSFWQEIRELVRANNSEFLMLDETIPNDPRMGENAFDMHFDTEGFTRSTHSVASGADPSVLVSDIRTRIEEGFPTHALVLNLTENHDEPRLLNKTAVDLATPDREEISDQEWEAGARQQRLCWAAGVCLPGVPGIYYGQERQISRYGESRHRGTGDGRGRRSVGFSSGNQSGPVNPDSDVRPGGRQRAFMNWTEYSESHLQFYQKLIKLYHQLDVLKPDAALYPVETGEANVLAFGRDASHLDGVDGPKRVLVLLNFDDSPVTVSVPSWISGVDLFTGKDVSEKQTDESGRDLELTDLLILEASEPFVGNSLGGVAGVAGQTDAARTDRAERDRSVRTDD